MVKLNTQIISLSSGDEIMAFKTKLAEQEIQLGTRKYRIYPEGEKIAWIWQLFGANRFVWNQFVATFEARYEANPQLKFPKIGILKSWQPLMRKEHAWLKKINSKYQLKIRNIRYDYLQKVTTELVKSYDVIAIEDLKVKNLLGNHKLAHNIANASWALFRALLAYKCEWYGKKLIVVPPQYTSRICSACGRKNTQFAHMKTRDWLAVRNGTCPYCQTDHDRDENAAKNILARAIN